MTERRYGRLFTVVILLCGMVTSGLAQSLSAYDRISKDRRFSASNYCIYPDTIVFKYTPPPTGKRPFYISHYSRHGSRYLSNRKGYDIPYKMLQKADSAGKLTPIGKNVMEQLASIISDSEGRWGDLTELGKQQQRGIARRMMTRFPEVFEGKAHINARSTTVNRCILSMGSAVQGMMSKNPKLQISMDASRHDMEYMNHQDQVLRDSMTSIHAKKIYDAYCTNREHNPRLIALLFNDSVYAKENVDEVWFNYYLLKSALIQQNTRMGHHINYLDLFTFEDIHQYWQKENAWWYFMYGPALINGGKQPFTQRYLLRKIIEEADSCLRLKKPGVQLRFGHETIILPLTCLMEINHFGYQTTDLETLEEHGWWACMVFPMASNIQFVFYREDFYDKDVLVKVLLNEEEATLPVKSDIAPYYHWADVRDYYLQKLEQYERERSGK
ncbi:MAG: histidine-type phosphatase [Prevotella sp.]|nr:histidine-type phosphatase [Prevotella sp.]